MEYKFCVLSEKPLRVDMYLSTLFKDFSRSYIQKLIDKWQLQINSIVVSKNIKIKPKDEIILKIKLEKLENIEPEDIKIDIIYEDENLLIINKDVNTNVHPVPWKNGKTWTLVNAILYHCKNKLPSINWVERPWIVHRLDKDTSWIILIAKTDFMMKYLSKIIKERQISKYYLAIVNGIIKNKEFKIESYIWRDPKDRLKMTVISPINPKIAITYWEVLNYIDDKYTLVKVKLETWRTHQIRVHFASIWYPILWDTTYWNKKVNTEIAQKYWLKRQALHAQRLEFELYWEQRVFEASLKDDMKGIIRVSSLWQDKR